MRFSTLSVLAVGAGLAHVSASPIRLVDFAGELPAPQTLRFGHAVPSASATPANEWVPIEVHVGGMQPHRMGCSRFRQKMINISNIFRQALGMPLIDGHGHKHKHHKHHKHHGHHGHHKPGHDKPGHHEPGHDKPGHHEPGHDKPGHHEPGHHEPDHHELEPEFHILPIVGSNPIFVPNRGPARGGNRSFHNFGDKSFTHRISMALMALGPWEGRAVAFVLGCGIGVILRMFWVLAVLLVRGVRGEPESTGYVILEEDAEDIIVPAPAYVVTDEKDKKDAPVA
ncbi:hypothetical protein BD779DRAFT_1542014 [Infundibulicybe gibba]|nr:hypothetical protein BD779DRAFT_1542014 [Infundibulicybe gibba]